MSRHWSPAKTELEAGVRGLTVNDVTDDTKIIMSQLHKPEGFIENPVAQPIVHSSTYRIKDVEEYQTILKEGGRIYVRLGNSTCEAAECVINQLESGAGSVVFASGMAAISAALLSFLKAGDHVVSCNPMYSGTHELMTKYLHERFNIHVTLVGHNIDEYRKAMRPNTKVLYGETPCNPHLTIMDLDELAKLGRSVNGLMTIVDSTFGTPYLQKPIKHDIDVVVHSATKYLGGHSDLCAGVATARTVDLWRKLLLSKKIYGGILSPHDASLLLRGIKTLHVRVERQSTTAQRLAEFLQIQPQVERVYYPGLTSHPQHNIAKRQMTMFGGMISFEMKGGLQAARTLVETVRIMTLAVSLGGPESLVEHVATMSHGPMAMSDAERTEANIKDGLIRLSCGLEDPNDLINDLKQALESIA